MSYLALYRRFRPDSFDKVIGQDAIVKTLTNQIKSDKIGHAYLFCGVRGTGKTTLAKIFAKAVNCLDSKDGSPCGECAACQNLSNPANLNVIEMDAASNNKVENVRAIRENVQFPPVGVKYKVYIIDEVHMLTTEAFNALLKTLEEPPKHAVFILATTEPHKIPATILSRCMRFDFKLVETEKIAELIRGIYDEIGKKYTSEAVLAIAKAGEGSVRDALSIADLCVSVGENELTYTDVLSVLGATDTAKTDELASAVFSGDVGKVLKITEELSSLGKSVGLTCKDLVSYVRDLTIVKTCEGANEILKLPIDVFKRMQTTVEGVDEHRLLRVLEIISKIENEIRYSSQPRAAFETSLIKAAMPSVDYDLDALLARIGKIEKALKSIEENGVVVTNVSANGGDFAKELGDVKRQINDIKTQIDNISVKQTVKQPQLNDVGVKTETPKTVKKSESKTDFDDFVPPEDDGGGAFISGDYSSDFSNEKPVETRKAAEEKPIVKATVAAPTVASAATNANVNPKRIWGSVVRKIRAAEKTILWVACQEMTADVKGNDFIIYAGEGSQVNVLRREENLKFIADVVGEFGNFNVKIITEENGEVNEENVTEKINKFFGEENVTIK